MNISPLFRTIHRAISSITSKVIKLEPIPNTISHRTCNNLNIRQYSNLLSHTSTNKSVTPAFLQPILPIYNSTCGLKMKVKLRLRCRKCFFVWKNGRKYVMCNEHPRHKQVERKPKEYSTWILTSASQSPKRPW